MKIAMTLHYDTEYYLKWSYEDIISGVFRNGHIDRPYVPLTNYKEYYTKLFRHSKGYATPKEIYEVFCRASEIDLDAILKRLVEINLLKKEEKPNLRGAE